MVNLGRFRRRQQQLELRLNDKPSRERHFLSITSSILSGILLILALVLPEWAKGTYGDCSYKFGLTKVDIIGGNNPGLKDMAAYYSRSQQILISCILSVSALTLISSLVASVISLGFPREKAEFLRHYAVFNIVSLLCVVLVAGLWLAVSETLPTSKFCPSSTAEASVSFGYSYYILLVSGLFSLGAASFNLLFARSAADRRRLVRNRFRQEQSRRRAALTTSRSGAPPAYSLLATSDFSEAETETSLSEPETEPQSPPPAYTP